MVDFAKLTAPFPPERVSWRVGSTTKDKTCGMALAYIDARDVMERLDEVCGPASWACRYPHANGKTVCEIGIRLVMPGDGLEWVWKADGAGDTDFEKEKGALSDAFKRAAVRWGIGRYLYDVEAPWVRIDNRGQIEPREYESLRALLGKKALAPRQEEPKGDPKTERARETYKRVHAGLKAALTVKDVDNIMATNKEDLDLLGEVHAKSFDDLVAYAETRRMDLRTAA